MQDNQNTNLGSCSTFGFAVYNDDGLDRDKTISRFLRDYLDQTQESLFVLEKTLDYAEKQRGANTIAHQYEYGLMFDLVRTLKTESIKAKFEDPNMLLPVAFLLRDVLHLYNKLPSNAKQDCDWYDDIQVELSFLDAWAKVRFSASENAMAKAHEYAKSIVVSFDVAGELVAMIIKMAYFFHSRSSGKPFAFIQSSAGELIGVSTVFVGKAIHQAKRAGYLIDKGKGPFRTKLYACTPKCERAFKRQRPVEP